MEKVEFILSNYIVPELIPIKGVFYNSSKIDGNIMGRTNFESSYIKNGEKK